ncbi:PilZ domain-containing protein [Fulvimonas yonginensis]|uniref:PilZ domain-containing protein n=1 Tax=Fulvimonas yonginensis TaxID=1495200 RepID=A0ABU8J8Y6_9GAMM
MMQNPQESRRAHRKPVNIAADVIDAMSGRRMGQLGNLSASGMLLIGTEAPRSEAIYQLRLPLPGLGTPAAMIEVGVQEQWHEVAATPGQVWAGYRIIAIADDAAAELQRWLELPD